MSWISDRWKDITNITTGGWIGGIMDLAGAVSQHDANQSAQAAANRNIAFQREMAETGIQKRVKDYMAAGLNPMLAYSQGGAMASGGSSIPELKSPVATAMQARMNRMQSENLASDIELKKASARNQDSQAAYHDWQRGERGTKELTLMDLEAQFKAAGIKKTEAEIQHLQVTINKVKEEILSIRQGTATSAVSAREMEARIKNLGAELDLKNMDVKERVQTLQSIIQQTFDEGEIKSLMLKNWDRFDEVQDTGWRRILRMMGFGGDEIARALEQSATWMATRRLGK